MQVGMRAALSRPASEHSHECAPEHHAPERIAQPRVRAFHHLLAEQELVREQLDETTPPPVAQVEEEEEAMRRDPRRALRIKPRPTRTAADAQRAAWSELDADGDGRITRAEAEVNADFKSRFELLDADHDGVVTDVEYRASDRVNAARGRDDAARHDPTLNDGAGDTSRDPPRARTDSDD